MRTWGEKRDYRGAPEVKVNDIFKQKFMNPIECTKNMHQ